MQSLISLFETHLRRASFAESSIDTYIYEAKRWFAWCEGHDVDPVHATRDEIEARREDMKARGLKPATRAQFVIVIRAFYEALIDEGQIKTNPTARIKTKTSRRDQNPKHLELDELKLLLESFKGKRDIRAKRDYAIVALMGLHGLRRIEVQRLDHADFTEKAPAFLRVTGKGGHHRRVYLREDSLAILRSYIVAKQKKLDSGEDALFISLRTKTFGERLRIGSISAAVERCLTAVSLRAPGVSCHALRHTFGTLSVAGGASIEQVRDAMGHQNLATTSIYVRAVDRIKHNPAKFIVVK